MVQEGIDGFKVMVLGAIVQAMSAWQEELRELGSDFQQIHASAQGSVSSKIQEALFGRHNMFVDDRARGRLTATLRRLEKSGHVQTLRSKGLPNRHRPTTAGFELVEIFHPEMPDPFCFACDNPGGRTDLNIAATAHGGTGAGSRTYPVCPSCLLKNAKEHLEWLQTNEAEGHFWDDDRRLVPMKIALLEMVIANSESLIPDNLSP